MTSFKAAYTLATPFAAAGGFAAMYERSRRASAAARALIDRFDSVARRVAGLDAARITANKWAEEDRSTRELLEVGRRVGVEKYESVLRAGKAPRLDAEGVRAEKVLYGGATTTSVWGRVARRQGKGVRRLMRTIEME
jgi:hypothetical protein